MNLLAQGLLSGLAAGAVYALIGSGLVLVYRTARLLNLAHGESFAVGAITVALLVATGVPMPLSLIGGFLAGTAVPVLLYRFVLRSRQAWPMDTLVLLTLSTAFLARGLMMALAGPDAISFAPMISGAPLRLAGGALPRQAVVLIALGLALPLAVGLGLSYTRLGRQLLATAENPDAAQLAGVNVERVRLFAFVLSGALAALTAILLVPLTSIDAQAGLNMTMRGFIAAAVAGMSPLRTVVSGFALGIFESLVGAYLGTLQQDPVVFLVLVGTAVLASHHIRFGGGRRA